MTQHCLQCGKRFRAASDERVCPNCKPQKEQESASNLTPREKEIVRLVGQAKLNKEIAFMLDLSEATVKENMNRIFRKLKVKNRTELAILASKEHDSASESAA